MDRLDQRETEDSKDPLDHQVRQVSMVLQGQRVFLAHLVILDHQDLLATQEVLVKEEIPDRQGRQAPLGQLDQPVCLVHQAHRAYQGHEDYQVFQVPKDPQGTRVPLDFREVEDSQGLWATLVVQETKVQLGLQDNPGSQEHLVHLAQ